MERHYVLAEVAKLVGRKPHQIVYLLTSGRIPEPEQRIGNRRLFSEADVTRLARHFKVTPRWEVVEAAPADADSEGPERLKLRPPFEVISTAQTGHEIKDGGGESSAGHRIADTPWSWRGCWKQRHEDEYKNRTLGITDDGMGKPTSLYQQYWSGKRYLRMLTCRKECELSYTQKKVLSYLIYKARDKAAVGTSVITRATRIRPPNSLVSDQYAARPSVRHQVRTRIPSPRSAYDQARMVRRSARREPMVGAAPNLSPLPAHGRWQAIPRESRWAVDRDGQRRPLDYVQSGERWRRDYRSAGGGSGGLLGCSPHTVRDAIGRLAKAGLILKRSDGFTLLDPKQSIRSWWRDRKKKVRVEEKAGVVPITDEGDQLGWIE